MREKLEREKIKKDTEEAKKMALQAKKAAQQDKAIGHLAYIADAFLTEDYQKALLRSKRAVKALPENPTLLFAHSQTLFANQKYGLAASFLRQALRYIDPEKQEVFFFHDFYTNQNALTAQIASLEQAAQDDPKDANLQLLLGYQLLGLRNFDQAQQALKKSQLDLTNKDYVEMLLKILEKSRQQPPSDVSAEDLTEKSGQDY